MKSASKKTVKQARKTSVAAMNPHWPPPRHASAKPGSTVELIFAGLLGFCYTSRGTCQVGFRTNTPDAHTPRIVIFENPGCFERRLNPGNAAMSLGITGALNKPAVTSYQESFPDRLTGDPNDIRWVIDLAADPWFPGKVAQPGMFSPILEVYHGMFLNLIKSNSTFNQIQKNTGKPVTPMGYVSRYVGVHIELKPQQTVTLQIDGARPVLLPSGNLTSATVIFANECDNCNGRSDFHDLITALGAVATDLDLGVDVAVDLPNLPGGCFHTARGLFSPFNTDPSPCMGAGFGGNDGFQ